VARHAMSEAPAGPVSAVTSPEKRGSTGTTGKKSVVFQDQAQETIHVEPLERASTDTDTEEDSDRGDSDQDEDEEEDDQDDDETKTGAQPETPLAQSQPESPLASSVPAHASYRLRVGIVSADGLRDADPLPGQGHSDPYCVCELWAKGAKAGKKAKVRARSKTKVIENTGSPIWNYEEVFDTYEAGDDLSFTVWDKDFGKFDDLLGKAMLKSDVFHPHGFDDTLLLDEAGKGVVATLKLRIVVEEKSRERSQDSQLSTASTGSKTVIHKLHPHPLQRKKKGLFWTSAWKCQNCNSRSSENCNVVYRSVSDRHWNLCETCFNDERDLQAGVSPQAAPPSDPSDAIICQGALQIQTVGNLRSRFFTLRADRLTYWNSEEDFKDGADAKGVIMAKDVVSLAVCDDWILDIFVLDKHLRLKADGHEDIERWGNAWTRVFRMLRDASEDPVLVRWGSSFAEGRPRKLVVTILSARGLRNADAWVPMGGVSDPYCTCKVAQHPGLSFKTKVVQNDLCPIWNHTHTFAAPYPMGSALEFAVYDKDLVSKDDLLGKCRLPCARFIDGTGFSGELLLEQAGKKVEAYLSLVVAFQEVEMAPEVRSRAQSEMQPALLKSAILLESQGNVYSRYGVLFEDRIDCFKDEVSASRDDEPISQIDFANIRDVDASDAGIKLLFVEGVRQVTLSSENMQAWITSFEDAYSRWAKLNGYDKDAPLQEGNLFLLDKTRAVLHYMVLYRKRLVYYSDKISYFRAAAPAGEVFTKDLMELEVVNVDRSIRLHLQSGRYLQVRAKSKEDEKLWLKAFQQIFLEEETASSPRGKPRSPKGKGRGGRGQDAAPSSAPTSPTSPISPPTSPTSVSSPSPPSQVSLNAMKCALAPCPELLRELSNPLLDDWLFSLKEEPLHQGLLGLQSEGRLQVRWCLLFRDRLECWDRPLNAVHGLKPQSRLDFPQGYAATLDIIGEGFIIKIKGARKIGVHAGGGEDLRAWSTALLKVFKARALPAGPKERPAQMEGGDEDKSPTLQVKLAPEGWVPRVASMPGQPASRRFEEASSRPDPRRTHFTARATGPGISINTHQNAVEASRLLHGREVGFLMPNSSRGVTEKVHVPDVLTRPCRSSSADNIFAMKVTGDARPLTPRSDFAWQKITSPREGGALSSSAPGRPSGGSGSGMSPRPAACKPWEITEKVNERTAVSSPTSPRGQQRPLLSGKVTGPPGANSPRLSRDGAAKREPVGKITDPGRDKMGWAQGERAKPLQDRTRPLAESARASPPTAR